MSDEKITVLLIEDEDIIREHFELSLENRFNFNVLVAQNGEEGIDIFQRERETIDIVVTDIAMPGSGGNWVIEQIRGKYPNFPIIAMSGTPEKYKHKEDLRIPFLNKPITVKILAETIDEILGKK